MREGLICDSGWLSLLMGLLATFPQPYGPLTFNAGPLFHLISFWNEECAHVCVYMCMCMHAQVEATEEEFPDVPW